MHSGNRRRGHNGRNAKQSHQPQLRQPQATEPAASAADRGKRVINQAVTLNQF